MASKTDVYEEIALDRSEEMPQGAHWSHCSVGQEPGETGTQSEVPDFCLRQWHPNEL